MIKINKIIIITLLIIVCSISFSKVYADVLKPGDYKPGNPTGYTNFYSKAGIAGIILGFVKNLGAIVSVLGIAIIGIRYMFASLEQKANYKETAWPFVIGIAITVGITGIISIIQKIAQ